MNCILRAFVLSWLPLQLCFAGFFGPASKLYERVQHLRIVNNGPRKGLGVPNDQVKPISVPGVTAAPYEKNHYLRLAKTPGVLDVWQQHLSLTNSAPAHNTTRDMIANFEEGLATREIGSMLRSAETAPTPS